MRIKTLRAFLAFGREQQTSPVVDTATSSMIEKFGTARMDVRDWCQAPVRGSNRSNQRWTN
jgi:hypothetical protein